MTACPAVARHGDHLYVRIYARPWRRCFRKTFMLKCWRCDVEVWEP